MNAYAPPVSDEQKAISKPLLDSFDNLCLMSGFYRGKPVAFVCQHEQHEDGTHNMNPLFIVLTQDMDGGCLDSCGAPLNNHEFDYTQTRTACPVCGTIDKPRSMVDGKIHCLECKNSFSEDELLLVVEGPCPYCGRVTQVDEFDSPHWFSPCTDTYCPSREKQQTVEDARGTCCGGTAVDDNGNCPICGDKL